MTKSYQMPPAVAFRSYTVTWSPARLRWIAADTPLTPAPITATVRTSITRYTNSVIVNSGEMSYAERLRNATMYQYRSYNVFYLAAKLLTRTWQNANIDSYFALYPSREYHRGSQSCSLLIISTAIANAARRSRNSCRCKVAGTCKAHAICQLHLAIDPDCGTFLLTAGSSTGRLPQIYAGYNNIYTSCYL